MGDRSATSSSELDVAPGLFSAERGSRVSLEDGDAPTHQEFDSPLFVGRRVEVDWRGGETYTGTIMHVEQPDDVESVFTVRYDDGDQRFYSHYKVGDDGVARCKPKRTDGTTGIRLQGPGPQQRKSAAATKTATRLAPGGASKAEHDGGGDEEGNGDKEEIPSTPESALLALQSAHAGEFYFVLLYN